MVIYNETWNVRINTRYSKSDWMGFTMHSYCDVTFLSSICPKIRLLRSIVLQRIFSFRVLLTLLIFFSYSTGHIYFISHSLVCWFYTALIVGTGLLVQQPFSFSWRSSCALGGVRLVKENLTSIMLFFCLLVWLIWCAENQPISSFILEIMFTSTYLE